jgi:TldD protein
MKFRIALMFLGTSALWGADVVFDAMQAELKRSMTLSLRELDKPYFISYSIDDGNSWSATAAQGALLIANQSRYRRPSLQVRVGDYNFDNSNGGRGGGRGASYNLPGFPLDDDPLVIRQYLWLQTDSAYKGAVQAIAQKRAAQRSVNVSDQLPDFAHATPFTLLQDRAPVKFPGGVWNDTVKRVSATFDGYPRLRDAVVEFSATDGIHRYINSEGTQIRQPQTEGSVRIRAAVQASDGMIMRDAAFFYTQDITKMFPADELTQSARGMADQLMKLAAAPVGDNYSGPVLFEGVASAQLMAEVLGRNLHIERAGAAGGRGGRGGPPGRGGAAAGTELEGRRGVRIMPEMFDVNDNPTLPLFGHAEVDDEGVPSKPVSLVEKGILKDFLRTRLPVPGFTESNGRALIGYAPAPTNLIITTSEKTPVADLRAKLIDICRQRGLPFAIIIRKLDFPGAGLASAPLYVYRLYVDGHEEIIRAVRLRSVNARSLKDILLAGDDRAQLDYVENGPGGSTGVTVVAPSVLIDDLEFVKVDENLPKLPVAPPPSLAAK